jgi:hypothetical protein
MSYFPETKEMLLEGITITINKYSVIDNINAIIYCLYNIPKNIIEEHIELHFFMKHIKFNETQITILIKLCNTADLNNNKLFDSFITELNVQQLLYINENLENSIGVKHNNDFILNNGEENEKEKEEKEAIIIENYIENEYYRDNHDKLVDLLVFIWDKMNNLFHNRILDLQIETNIHYFIYIYQSWISILMDINIELVEKVKRCLMTLTIDNLIYIGV